MIAPKAAPESVASAKAMRSREAKDLPAELLTHVLTKLPDLSHHLASQVSRAWRDAERACDRLVVLKLDCQDKHSRLRAFAAWGRTRVGAVAATLTATSTYPYFRDGPLSLASLGAMPTLQSLELSLDVPVNFASLAACTGLTALRVTVPDIAGLEYYLDDDDNVAQHELIEWFEPEDTVLASSRYGALMALAGLLEPGVTPLSRLQSLDVDGVVPPRGDIRVMSMKVPMQSTLPWLTCLTQLTRLKARVFTVDEGSWALPCLKELHVCGGYQREVLCTAHDDERQMWDDRLGLECKNLERMGPQLTKLVLESCELQGEALVLGPTVKELHLLTCGNWKSCAKAASCPGLCRLRVVLDTADEVYTVSWGSRDLKARTLSMSFQPMPQLTELVLDARGVVQVWGGAEDRRIKHCRQCGITLWNYPTPGPSELY